MPADLTREEIERWSNAQNEALMTGPPGVASDSFARLLAAAAAHMDEPARLAYARAEGVREGIERARRIAEEWLCQNCGSWFHPQDAEPCCARPNWEREHKAGELVELLAALSPPPAEPTGMTADGWIEWKGGECPVEPDAVVEVRMRDGRIATFDDGAVDEFWWGNDGCSVDILAYRIVKPAEPSAPVAEGER